MSEQKSGERKEFDPADYPALREFLPAYLHQDFRQEYESAAEAVKRFVSEASGDEIVQVREEWRKFREDFAARGLEEVRAALEDFGSAWYPQGEGELREVDEILARAAT